MQTAEHPLESRSSTTIVRWDKPSLWYYFGLVVTFVPFFALLNQS